MASGNPSVNWRQAAGEASLIFVGVLVALLGQGQWEAHADRVTVAQHLASLHEELVSNIEGLEEIAAVHEHASQSAVSVLQVLSSGETTASNDSLVSLAVGLAAYNIFIPSTAATQSLLGSGDFALIEAPILRRRLSSYARSVTEFEGFAADLVRFQLEELRPTLGAIVPLADRRMVDQFAANGVDIPESNFTPSLSLLRTLAFENLAFYKMAYEVDVAANARELAREIKDLLGLLEATDGLSNNQ